MKTKNKHKAERRKREKLGKGLICHIELNESGKKIFEFKGNLLDGFKNLKTQKEDVFQLEDGDVNEKDEYKTKEHFYRKL